MAFEDCPFFCSHILYDWFNKILLTAAGTNVRVWNASTGQLQSKWDNVAPDEITAFCLDYSHRKFFIGTHEGLVSSHAVNNGWLVRNYGAVHKSEVSSLVYMSTDRRFLISCSTDGAVKILPDSVNSNHKAITVSKSTINARCCAYSTESQVVCARVAVCVCWWGAGLCVGCSARGGAEAKKKLVRLISPSNWALFCFLPEEIMWGG